ncbi:unnamed protein product [Protopolystoma xenopodis]|uniref:Uncharacterized protein n=1 Tax=Protopolystoma xenopodis TaxID=117903 RepID=A0A448XPI0_9PLAT|nr:unnamed protein product [Protopolystoma xenopodis]
MATWEAAGVPVMETERIQLIGDLLILRGLEPKDVKLYRYGYEYEPKRFATVCFFPVFLKGQFEVSCLTTRDATTLNTLIVSRQLHI